MFVVIIPWIHILVSAMQRQMTINTHKSLIDTYRLFLYTNSWLRPTIAWTKLHYYSLFSMKLLIFMNILQNEDIAITVSAIS
jgi:hypothetical protein